MLPYLVHHVLVSRVEELVVGSTQVLVVEVELPVALHGLVALQCSYYLQLLGEQVYLVVLLLELRYERDPSVGPVVGIQPLAIALLDQREELFLLLLLPQLLVPLVLLDHPRLVLVQRLERVRLRFVLLLQRLLASRPLRQQLVLLLQLLQLLLHLLLRYRRLVLHRLHFILQHYLRLRFLLTLRLRLLLLPLVLLLSDLLRLHLLRSLLRWVLAHFRYKLNKFILAL